MISKPQKRQGWLTALSLKKIGRKQMSSGVDEFAQTILLKEKGILAVYKPKNGDGLPSTLKDPDGYWTGFGGRARVLLINTKRIDSSQIPKSILDLTTGTIPSNQVGISLPMFGTGATHAAAYMLPWGKRKPEIFTANWLPAESGLSMAILSSGIWLLTVSWLWG